MTNKHFLSYDCCRCTAETCPVKEKCLRYLTKGNIGPRTPFVVWGYEPKEPCEMYWPNEISCTDNL